MPIGKVKNLRSSESDFEAFSTINNLLVVKLIFLGKLVLTLLIIMLLVCTVSKMSTSPPHLCIRYSYMINTHTPTHSIIRLTSISSDSWISPISLSAVCSTAHEGTPFFDTLSCCCNHAAIISITHLSVLPR